MHSANVKFLSQVFPGCPSLTYFMRTLYVQIPSIKGICLLFCYTAEWNFKIKGSTTTCVHCFFQSNVSAKWLKITNPCRNQYCNYIKLTLLKIHTPKADPLSPCKLLVPLFSMFVALEIKMISGLCLCLECVPLYRKESAKRGYKNQWVMTHGPILRDISVSPLRHERTIEIILRGC